MTPHLALAVVVILALSGCTPATIFPSPKPTTMYDPPPMGYTVTIEMHSPEYVAYFERFKAMGMSDGDADEQATLMEKLK